jgi:uroporphyrinogen decarboxylase
MSKRDIVLSLLDPATPTPYLPAAFFLHFDPRYHCGQAAIDKHLEYFRYTGMDFVKIQYEQVFPRRPEITTPTDWSKLPCYGVDFYAEQVEVARGLVEAAGEEALVVMTLYSPLMCAGHTIGKENLRRHFTEDPEQVKEGMEIITESLLTFVRGCIEVGIDGFYHSTQGGETQRFEGSLIFEQYIKPYDLVLMEEIERNCQFNILHVCDYEGGYSDYDPFLDYPGHVVNASLQLGEKTLTGTDVAEMFGRPFMGGLDRHGIIVSGSKAEIQAAVTSVCRQAPPNFILGADCTLPGNMDWENIKIAIDTAHTYQRS